MTGVERDRPQAGISPFLRQFDLTFLGFFHILGYSSYTARFFLSILLSVFVMNAKISRVGLALLLALPLLSSVINLGCQTEYASPLPGIVEVRLKTVSTNIAFDPLNNFILTVPTVVAIRDDFAQAVIYPDLQAIDREDTKLNTLDVRARDSSLMVGQTYLPPGSYLGIGLLIEPARQAILDGYRVITVERTQDFDPRLLFVKPFQIKELTTTRIILELNLDSTLLRRANTYLFRPFYGISSINEIR